MLCIITENLNNKTMTYSELSKPNSGYFECQMPILAESAKAICFDADKTDSSHHRGVWIPKSQMQVINATVASDTRYFIKNWLYQKLS